MHRASKGSTLCCHGNLSRQGSERVWQCMRYRWHTLRTCTWLLQLPHTNRDQLILVGCQNFLVFPFWPKAFWVLVPCYAYIIIKYKNILFVFCITTPKNIFCFKLLERKNNLTWPKHLHTPHHISTDHSLGIGNWCTNLRCKIALVYTE